MFKELTGIIYYIKNIELVRLIISPLKNYERKKRTKKYGETSDSLRMQTLKNIHEGDRCFIVGNGPSLSSMDLEMLEGECCFGMNRIYEIFEKTKWRPNYYIAVDPDFVNANIDKILDVNADKIFLSNICKLKSKNRPENLIFINEYSKFVVNKWNDHSPHISTDVSKYFSIGYTVAFTAIQLAIYMGFRELYLLGIDFNYSVMRDKNGKIIRNNNVKDYFNGKKYVSTVLNYNSCLNAYKMAEEYANKHGIKIFNATRGGKLEVFPRVILDKVVAESKIGENVYK